jgi:glyoxylase-like metal-dependent hydrolase (beta-lactamase superfamily II)
MTALHSAHGAIAAALSWRVGTTRVTTIADGYIQATLEANLRGLDIAAGEKLQKTAFRTRNPRYTVNAFLIEDGENPPILIDTGMGRFGGTAAGRLMRSLAVAGVAPEAIASILLTHLHLDHSGGLQTAEGNAAFPNARLFVHEEEIAYWLSEAAESNPSQNHPEWVSPTREVVRPMQLRTTPFRDGEAVAKTITAVHLPGHTPGHSGFLLESGGERLLFWGDIVHAPSIQLPLPEVGVDADSCLQRAASTREALLKEVSNTRMLVAGAHLDFPGLGYVARDDDAFRFIAEQWVLRI